MNGMEPRPTATTAHFLAGCGSRWPACWLRRNLETAHSLFMVSPGMATEASPCQTRVSATAREGAVVEWV